MNEVTRPTDEQAMALEYFELDYAESDEPDAGWFAYTRFFEVKDNYPGSSCECIEDVVRWWREQKAAEEAARR